MGRKLPRGSGRAPALIDRDRPPAETPREVGIRRFLPLLAASAPGALLLLGPRAPEGLLEGVTALAVAFLVLLARERLAREEPPPSLAPVALAVTGTIALAGAALAGGFFATLPGDPA